MYHITKDSTIQHPVLNKTYGLDYKINDYILYVNNNFHVQKQIKKASEASRVSVAIISCILIAIGKASKYFSTCSSQKHIAFLSCCSVNTVQKAIKALKKVGLINVRHRYSGEGALRRRVTSRTTLSAFIKYAGWVKDRITRAANDVTIIKNKISNFLNGKQADTRVSIDYDTGELCLSGEPQCT